MFRKRSIPDGNSIDTRIASHNKSTMKKNGVFVPKIIGSLFVMISLAFSSLAHAALDGGGGMDSGGGSGLSMMFRHEGLRIAQIISTLPNFPLNADQFKELVRTTRIEVSDEQLQDSNGNPVPALVSQQSKLLRLDGTKVIEIIFAPQLSLTFVAHQYLQIAGIDDQGNKISSLLLASKNRVLVSISCQSTSEAKDITFVNYKGSDSNGDGKVDEQSTLAYTKSDGALFQHDMPLVTRSNVGTMLTYSNMGIYAAKLFLPEQFLEQAKGEVSLAAYFVNEMPAKTRVAARFICKHVTEDNYQSELRSQSQPGTHQKGASDDDVDEAFKKAMIEMLTKSFKLQANYAIKAIGQIPHFPLTTAQFEELVATTRMEFTDENLFEPGGLKVDALNYPTLKLIRFNYARAFAVMMAPRQSLQLIIHEFLGIARVDDRDYSVSQRVLELSGETLSKWTCETESSEQKVILSYEDIDYNGDKETDETVVSAKDSSGKSLQVPLSIRDVSIDEPVGLIGYQVLWSTANANHAYQFYLPQKAIVNGAGIRLPYFEVSLSEDDFKKPAGTLSCHF
jgi:hypothetical protein